MKGISKETHNFLEFACQEYQKALEHSEAAPYLEGAEEDDFFIDNVLARLSSESRNAILAEHDIKFLQHVFDVHQQCALNGVGSLWTSSLAEETSVMETVMNEVLDAYETEKNRWLTYKGFSGTYQVLPKLNIYGSDNNLYLGLDSFDLEFGGFEPFTDITTNLDYGTLTYLHAAIDTNNNGKQAMDFLIDHDFGRFTGVMLPSGFCTYPVFEFNEDKLREIDPEVFAQYARAHGKEIKPSLDDTLTAAKAKTHDDPKSDEPRQGSKDAPDR